MKQTISIACEIPDGYEATGEHRGTYEDYYLGENGDAYRGTFSAPRIILRKIEPIKKMRPMTEKKIAMLPRGTAFIRTQKDRLLLYPIYRPVIRYKAIGGITIQNQKFSEWKGYRLPTDPDDMEPRPFTVEVSE